MISQTATAAEPHHEFPTTDASDVCWGCKGLQWRYVMRGGIAIPSICPDCEGTGLRSVDAHKREGVEGSQPA